MLIDYSSAFEIVIVLLSFAWGYFMGFLCGKFLRLEQESQRMMRQQRCDFFSENGEIPDKGGGH
jgi:hypothetical protein